MPLRAGSFVGLIPGYCRFDPGEEEREELVDLVRLATTGLYFEDQGRLALLSYVKKTDSGLEGNVIGG